MRILYKIVLLSALLQLYSCKKSHIEQSDFEWIYSFVQKDYSGPYITEFNNAHLLLFGEKDSIIVNLNGEKVDSKFNFISTKPKPRIIFYAQTIGLPMIFDGRKSVVKLNDSSEFSEIYYVDKIKISLDFEYHRNNDKKYDYLQFKHNKTNETFKLEFDRYDNIKEIYDVIQIDKNRLIITFSLYRRNEHDDLFCVGMLNLSDLI